MNSNAIISSFDKLLNDKVLIAYSKALNLWAVDNFLIRGIDMTLGHCFAVNLCRKAVYTNVNVNIYSQQNVSI